MSNLNTARTNFVAHLTGPAVLVLGVCISLWSLLSLGGSPVEADASAVTTVSVAASSRSDITAGFAQDAMQYHHQHGTFVGFRWPHATVELVDENHLVVVDPGRDNVCEIHAVHHDANGYYLALTRYDFERRCYLTLGETAIIGRHALPFP